VAHGAVKGLSGDSWTAARLRPHEVAGLLLAELRQALQRSSHPQICVELFSGSGGIARRWRHLGYGTIEFDLRKGPQYDLTSPAVLNVLQGWITSGVIACVWIGVPCSTWSLARRGKAGRPGGPIRTIEFIYGLPPNQLRPQDVCKLLVGNSTMRCCARIARLCNLNFIPAMMENPNSSRIWHAPPIISLLKAASCTSHVVDFCAFGTPWQKRTKLVGWHVGKVSSLDQKCKGSRGLCANGKHHFVLRGSKPGTKVPWTRIAEPYPTRICRVAADAMIKAHDLLHLNRLFSLARG
jgi:hypothetical protein